MAEIQAMGLSYSEAQSAAKKRVVLRNIAIALCLTGDEEDK